MAGRIPQSFINDLLARLDIVDVIDARITLKKAGKNYQALCPFHNEKTPSFSVSPDKQFYHCFGCGVSGTALTFLMEHDRLEFVEAVETLARLVGVEVPREASGRPQPDHTDLFELLARAERLYRTLLRDCAEAVDYLKGRGVAGVVARDFGIGFAPDEWHTVSEAFAGTAAEADLLKAGLLTKNDKGNVYDRFRGRIMFPIRDTRGRVIGFGGRVMAQDAGPKYLNGPETPVFHKGRELYGLFEARKALRRIDQLLMVEGYMDVVALAQAGIANAVASLGTAATTEHFHKLYRYADAVICCFDGDAAGRQAAWRALENALPTLTEGRQLSFMFLPDGEDPDSLVRKEGKEPFLQRVQKASPAIEYLFARLAENLDLRQLDGQAKLASLALPFIERVPEGILKQLMSNRLELLTGFTAETAARPRGSPRTSSSQTAGQTTASAQLSALSRRLLHYILHQPEVAREVPESLAEAVEALAAEDAFAEIVNYIVKNPGVGRSEILGRYAGEKLHSVLVELASRPTGLAGEAMAQEFCEGLAQHVDLAARRGRQRLLADMKENPSQQKLREFWSLKQDQAARRSGGSQPSGSKGNP
ncbi:MAG: DNA primase [Gammaproteobacteria bacterium]|nr:DNA primase [Gammaproteobacteria bacterium]